MKLTIIQGIANDLANHLDYQISLGYFKDIPKEIDSDVLEEKDGFDRFCVAFFKERLPESFDFSRIKRIRVKTARSMSTLSILITVNVDDKEFHSRARNNIPYNEKKFPKD